MIKITKVSSRKYEVFAIEDDFTHLIYTIKRITPDKYLVRSMFDDIIQFPTLQEAKSFVRGETQVSPKPLPPVEGTGGCNPPENWLSFFVKHTKGKKFETQKESNENMAVLSKRWKEIKTRKQSADIGQKSVCSLGGLHPPTPPARVIRGQQSPCSLENGCCCKSPKVRIIPMS